MLPVVKMEKIAAALQDVGSWGRNGCLQDVKRALKSSPRQKGGWSPEMPRMLLSGRSQRARKSFRSCIFKFWICLGVGRLEYTLPRPYSSCESSLRGIEDASSLICSRIFKTCPHQRFRARESLGCNTSRGDSPVNFARKVFWWTASSTDSQGSLSASSRSPAAGS